MRTLSLVSVTLIAILGVALLLAVCTAAAGPAPAPAAPAHQPPPNLTPSHPSFQTEGGAVGRAIWANTTECDPNTLKLTGSVQRITGGIHSNGDVHVNGNNDYPSVFTGPVEYVSTVSIQGAIIVDPPDNQPRQVEPDPLPLLFDIHAYAPGGHRAIAAGASYYYFSSEDYPYKVTNTDLVARGLLDPDGNLASGLYFADGKFSLNGSLTGVGVTFVARNSIDLSCSGCFFTSWEPELLFFTVRGEPGACNVTAVAVSLGNSEWFGLIYAPYGAISLSNASSSSFHGTFAGHTIDLSGSQVDFFYQPRYDPMTRTITILSPAAGEIFTAPNNYSVTIPVTVVIEHLALPTEGYWRLLVDGNEVTQALTATATVDLPLGRHLLTAELRFTGGGLAASDLIEVLIVPAQIWISFDESSYLAEEASATAEVTVTIAPPSPLAATVVYSTADGTARAGQDYQAASGTITFAAGITHQLVTISIIDDAFHEADETLFVTLMDPFGAAITGTNPVTLTILDDDPPPAVAFAGSHYLCDEGAALLPITVTLDAPSGLTATVGYATIDGTAIAGEDYLPATGVLTYSPGVTTQEFIITILDDQLPETDEFLLVALFDPANALISGTNPVTVTVIDDDPPPVVGFALAEYGAWEGQVGIITVTLDLASVITVSVSYSTSDGTATAGEDYLPAHGILVFPPATLQQILTITVLYDGDHEGDETLYLALSDPVNADLGLSRATLVILDDDRPPSYLYLPLLVRSRP